MWFDKLVIKVLLLIAKILARHGDKSYAHEIEKLEEEIFKKEGEE